MADTDDPFESHLRQIKLLLESVWERRADLKSVGDWLEQFEDSEEAAKSERLQALFLLSQFMYFGSFEVRALLRSLYRDHFEYRIVEEIRQTNSETKDRGVIRALFNQELIRTRFVGLGNPSESSFHLLYFFRQENALAKDLFIGPDQIFRSMAVSGGFLQSIRAPEIKNYILIDDLCGSGQQAEEYSADLVVPLKSLAAESGSAIRVSYLALFGTADGMDRIRKLDRFDDVGCVVELDATFKCFSKGSRYYVNEQPPISREFAEQVCRKYGSRLYPKHPLGYEDSQLLLAFSHNTPDNTLPIFSYDEPNGQAWIPMFKRYPKV